MYIVLSIMLAGGLAAPDSTENDQSIFHSLKMYELSDPRLANPSRDPHYLQVIATYEPGPGPGILGQYVYAAFPSGFISATFGWKSQLLGSLGYTHILELDILGRQRISITPTLFSDYEPNRLLDEVQVDERRSGGKLNVTYNYRFPERYRFIQYLELQHTRIWINPEESSSSFSDLTTVQLGPRLFRSAFEGLLPADILVEGRLIAGWDHDQEVLFSRIGLGGRWHNTLGGGFAYHSEVYGEWAGRDVPLVERPSFGGSLSVRGYRLDEILVRTHMTAQQEIWMPVPGTMNAERGFGAALRRNIRLAAFFDAAAIGKATNADHTGIRAGAGLGLRIRAGSMTLRADWGHRMVDIRDNNFRGDFFLSIRSDFDFFLFL